ncbi:protein kinase domain-containing protein [Thiocapsa roseopersicina]|uniref:Serine/threonine protein kinase n=1 Tax=Thiocapsa roseopersicina TaxID=1058 RepID=A0A1H2VSI0_THIRO|nr:protein kinase [Thiocapsa roseopersicina]SDW70904.1 Serine/threonine protein kinase [Thiocapsa roseopersicina]
MLKGGGNPEVEIDRAQLPQISGYTTEAVLGEGGMATVYLAVQESLSRRVALKVMKPLLMVDADFCRRFLNEGRLIAKLTHPNIVTVYDIGASDRYHYLSMTYLPGGTLKETIGRGLSLERTWSILGCLADALGYAHRQGIVHRDIKPSNVLFSGSGAPVLTDFGIAKTIGNETKLTSTGMLIGSIGYMSPEQARGLEVDNRSDLYSLGVLLWQMLTGTLPYSAPDPFALALMHANEPIPKLPGHLSRFQPVIEGLMAKDPADRMASAEELLRVVEGVLDEGIGASTPSDADATVLMTKIAKRAPGPRPGTTDVLVVQPPAPRSRFGLAAAVVAIGGLVGAAAFLGYGSLRTDNSETPDAVPTGRTGTGQSAAVPDRPDEADAGALRSSAPSSAPLTSTRESLRDDSGDSPMSAVSPSSTADASTSPRESGQRRIDALLDKARDQWNAGRLTEPPGDNAFESYSRVLELDPENLRARQGLIQIGRVNAATRIFLSADALLKQGAIDEARRMIETGLRMNPDDERLKALQRALE